MARSKKQRESVGANGSCRSKQVSCFDNQLEVKLIVEKICKAG